MANILYKGKTTIVNGYWVQPPVPGDGVLLWTPEQITTDLWLDAKTQSSVVLSSGTVSQWLDLSGNNRHAIQSTSLARPSYIGNNSIVFNGTSHFLLLPDIIVRSVFFVMSGGAVTRGGLGGSRNVTGEDFTPAWNGNRFEIGYRRRQSSTIYNSGLGMGGTIAQSSVSSYIHNNSADLLMAANGNILYNQSTGVSWNDADRTVRVIGRDYLGAEQFFDGSILEIILIGSAVDTTTRQLIEGYLAHKWELDSLLPIGHPYKDNPPLAP